ncbi:MAG: hypothetical protein J6U13_11405 [Salinivirgaceae bacterium]|nr:hypothetical protein [Salinivirgaceae bacterium]MBR5168677.1 hypothetical protein [Salinivirgaceae bacterium]
MEKKSVTKFWIKEILTLLVTIVGTYTILWLIAGWLCVIDGAKSYCWYNGIWHGINLQGNIIHNYLTDGVLWIAPAVARTNSYLVWFWIFGILGILVVMGAILKLLTTVFFGKRAISDRMIAKAVLVAETVDGSESKEEKQFFRRIFKEKLCFNDDELKEIQKEIEDGDLTYAIQDSQIPELIKNIAAMIAADGKITDEEAELIFRVASQNNYPREKAAKLVEKYMK